MSPPDNNRPGEPPYADDPELAGLRTMPRSVEAEQSVLGGLLLLPESWDAVAELLQAEDFHNSEHRAIYRQMARLVDAAKTIDPVTVADALEAAGELEAAGGFAYLAELAKETPSAANIGAYAGVVRERSILRLLIQTANAIAESGYRPKGRSAKEVLEDAERNILHIAERDLKGAGPQEAEPLVQGALNRIKEIYESGNKLTGVSTGFADLDGMTSGLQASELIIVAGRPSMGKTSFAMNMVEHAVLHQDKPVLVFSMEMPAEQLMMRMLSSLGRINQGRIRKGEMRSEDWAKLNKAAGKLQTAKLFIDDAASLSPAEIRSRARRMAREHGELGMVVVDYLQLMQVPGFRDGRTAEITEISRDMKAMAGEFRCPLVALSQLSRAVESRPNKRPVNSDLRESGAIEQDADVILFIYRDELYNEDTEHKGVAEILIGKQRNGPIGTCRLAFRGEYTRFENLAKEEYEELQA